MQRTATGFGLSRIAVKLSWVTEPTTGELRSVLIVTGSARTRRMYAEYLAWRGIHVREVDGAAATVRELAAQLPDVVVTDERLPDSTGQELVRALRRSRYTFDLPVVVLCSDTFAADAERSRGYGCDRVLVVPILPPSLHDALHSTVEECAASRASRPFESWLFVRVSESVWIVRTSDFEISVAGPGRGRGVYVFSDEQELLAFQTEYERRLRRTGFALETAGRDRRSGRDRRRVPRFGVVDRRAIQ